MERKPVTFPERKCTTCETQFTGDKQHVYFHVSCIDILKSSRVMQNYIILLIYISNKNNRGLAKKIHVAYKDFGNILTPNYIQSDIS
jgi:hypothetical protein